MNDMQLKNSDRHQQSIIPTCLHADHILKKKCAILDTPGVQGLAQRINQWMNLLIMSYLDDDFAILYANGENVYVWNIQAIPEK